MTGSAPILTVDKPFTHSYCTVNDSTVILQLAQLITIRAPHGASRIKYGGWNFNSGNYLFTTDTK